MAHKFNARKAQVDGYTFDSKKEAKRYEQLRLMERAGDIRDLKVHQAFPLDVNGNRVCTFKPDFVYRNRHGFVVEDVKGYKKGPAYQHFRTKAKLFEAIYGIRVIEV